MRGVVGLTSSEIVWWHSRLCPLFRPVTSRRFLFATSG